MKKVLSAILLAAIALAMPCGAQEMNAGEAKVTFGKKHVLWKQVKIGEDVYSDFKAPEPGKLLDVSGSKAGELRSKVKKLNASAPCRMSRIKSKHGDEMIILQNGLVKIVVVPALGGRIIEISNKATGANIFMDNYRQAEAAPDLNAKKPPTLGGWAEGVTGNDRNYWRTPYEIKAVEQSDDKIVIRATGKIEAKTWGVPGQVTVERTIGMKRGSAHISMHIKLTNHSGEKEREIRFRPHVRHALGSDIANDEFWLSSLGYVVSAPMPGPNQDHHIAVRAEEKIDTWQAIIDRVEREGAVILPGGEISGRICIYKFSKTPVYTFENTSELREHVVEGSTIEVGHDYAPVLNFDAVTFANSLVAVEFVPEKLHFSPGEEVKAIAGAAKIAKAGFDRISIIPKFSQHEKETARLEPISVEATLLVADPKEVKFNIPSSLDGGWYDLIFDVIAGNEKVGSFRYRVHVTDAVGTFLKLLRPADDGYGRGISAVGTLEKAEVVVDNSADGVSKGLYKFKDAALLWTTRITPVGNALKIVHAVDFSSFPEDVLLQSFGMSFPFRLGTHLSKPEIASERVRHQYQKMTRVTVGSRARDEQWLVDQAKDTNEPGQTIAYYYLSDSGGNRFPKWRFGGVLQKMPTTSWIWKSSNYNSAPTVVVQEETSAGWVDVFSQLTNQGVLVYMPKMAESAPKELIVDGEAGVVKVYFFPPHVPALSLKKAGKRGRSRAEEWGLGKDKKVAFTFFVHFHSKDIAGYMQDKGNIAKEIRELVANIIKIE